MIENASLKCHADYANKYSIMNCIARLWKLLPVVICFITAATSSLADTSVGATNSNLRSKAEVSTAPPELEVVADAAFSDIVSQPDKQQQKEINRIEKYINSIHTFVADFTQVAPDGAIASGKFYLQRPGKMRWQYEPPTPVLIITNNGSVVYYDYELEQVTHWPIDTSLASILARKNVDLNDPNIVIDELTTSPGAVRLRLYEKGNKEEGSLTLEMADQPLSIRNIIVTDAQGQTTTVSLNKARFGIPLERSLFIWKDPRGVTRR